MRKFYWSLWPLLASTVFLIRCGNDSTGSPLLQGHIAIDSLETLQIAYSLDGDKLNMTYQEIKPDAEGNFSFENRLPNQTLDADLYVDDDIFGVHLEQGKTAAVSIRKADNGSLEIAFSGDNADASGVYNAYARAFDIMNTSRPIRPKPKHPTHTGNSSTRSTRRSNPGSPPSGIPDCAPTTRPWPGAPTTGAACTSSWTSPTRRTNPCAIIPNTRQSSRRSIRTTR